MFETLTASLLKTSMVKTSLDGSSWTRIKQSCSSDTRFRVDYYFSLKGMKDWYIRI